MASCDEYQVNIVALFDNEAGDEELRLAAGHLQDCPPCRAFCLDLIAIRRSGVTAPIPSLSPEARRAVLDGIQTDQVATGSCAKDKSGWLRLGRIGRWAAVLVMGLLLALCIGLNRQAQDLRTRLQAAERHVASIRAEDQAKEAQDKQQKAIAALYFRMAELEERVDRYPSAERTAIPVQVPDHPARQRDF